MSDDDGTFTSGSVVNKAFVDQIYGQIDDQVHSLTNTAIKPKAITDEVVAARGSLGTLDARLDVALNNDGTLKTQASLITVAEVQAGLGSRNVAVNGDFDDWSAGASAAPDNFTLTTLTIVRTGSGEADTSTFGAGRYAARLTRAGTDGSLKQTVIAAADFANHANVKGQKVSVAVKVHTVDTNLARVTVDDGATTSSSSYHSGDGVTEGTLNQVETLTVTHQISGSATKLEVLLELNNTSGDAYFGGLVIVFAPYAPSDWQPLSSERDASSTRRGLVSILAQTWAGIKTFLSPPIGARYFSRTTADFTKNANVTLGNVTGLSFPVVANGVYVFKFVLYGISSIAADWKFAITFPAAPTSLRYGLVDNSGNALTPKSTDTAAAAITAETGGIEFCWVIEGMLRNGANAGTVQLQAAQQASDATNSIIRTDSFVVADQIS
jgi:hypothetical protein